MNIFKRLFQRYKGGPPSLADIDSWPSGMRRQTAGENVTVETAMSYSPIWQAVDLITSDVSKLPWIVYERVDTPWGEGKVRARTHPAYGLLKRSTGMLSTNLWIIRMIANAMLYGNGYSVIVRSDGIPRGLRWRHPSLVEPKEEDDKIFYKIKKTEDGRARRYAAEDVFHLPGVVVDNVNGLGVVEYAATLIGKQLAGDKWGADFFANAGTPQGYLHHPRQLTEKTKQNLLAAWRKQTNSDRGQPHRVLLLDNDVKWQKIGVSPADAQLLELAGFGVKDAARFFNIPSHKLGDDTRTSFNSVEQENLSYFDSSLGKWVSRLQNEADTKLFSQEEQQSDSHFSEFVLDAALRADTEARYKSYAIAITHGIQSRNEVRARENLNPYEGGEEFLSPLNMKSNIGDPQNGENDDQNRTLALRDAIFSEFERANKRILAAAARAANKPEEFLGFINRIGDLHRAVLMRSWDPTFRVAGVDSTGIGEKVDDYLRHVTDSMLAISECQPAELPENLTQLVPSLETYSRAAAAQIAQGSKA